ncbi:RES family NAD+ phosphorylase [Coraliomargarita sp. SDUM461004]|uniref:RES family NAD+ phosphorylase n=1 Tax=Thalassobacterium sedimentorum TaxID=3041258 RepID=A0ABU1ALM6_9BACT|nr:RES family NAD+ phosphorylase [Coraliomargarita sp. SDUM461004]MDQ8195688.1 RES family NAD+ phosphorylase [Coraliomargarita sp. SDUM461004]
MAKNIIQILDPDWLERFRLDLLSDKDSESINWKFGQLLKHYQLLNYRFNFSEPIWRARICSESSGYQNVKELEAPPPSMITKPGRINNCGESVFYGSFNKHAVFEEIKASEGCYVHIAGFKIKEEIRCGLVGEYYKVHRSGKSSISDEAGALINRILSGIPHKKGIGFILIDAILSEILAKKNASAEGYLYTRALGRQLLEKLPDIDGLVYPSVASSHAMNLALNVDAARSKLELSGNSVLKIVKRYEYGIYDYELIRNASGHYQDGTINWEP